MSHPQGNDDFGVNRSPGLASSYLRTFPPGRAVATDAFVRFTVTGIARKLHPCSHDAPPEGERAAPCGADTPAIHLSPPLYMPSARASRRFPRRPAATGFFFSRKDFKGKKRIVNKYEFAFLCRVGGCRAQSGGQAPDYPQGCGQPFGKPRGFLTVIHKPKPSPLLAFWHLSKLSTALRLLLLTPLSCYFAM